MRPVGKDSSAARQRLNHTIADLLGRPIGSIGPTRARCLDRLRRLLPAGIDPKEHLP
ncbi:MAG: hypothetical protein M3487_00600 [Actinomycetota bacterium]|nr:hypothetical protein [Acidimicrobiia bacterium]MDQ3468267.1 hypothetical protein [Actinomycetota bacterium]